MEWSKAQSGENLLRSTMSNEMPTNQCENSPVRSIFDVRAPLTCSVGRIKKRQSGKAKREKERRKKRVEKTIFSYREISAAKKKRRVSSNKPAHFGPPILTECFHPPSTLFSPFYILFSIFGDLFCRRIPATD